MGNEFGMEFLKDQGFTDAQIARVIDLQISASVASPLEMTVTMICMQTPNVQAPSSPVTNLVPIPPLKKLRKIKRIPRT